MQISSFQDPNTYAQQYATQNNLSLDDAKSQLKSRYGAPSQQMNPDAYAQQYATENNISLEKAKAQLKAKYGDPVQAKGYSFGNTLTSDTFTSSANTYSNISLSDLFNDDDNTDTQDTSIISFIKGLLENLRTGKNNGENEDSTTKSSNQDNNPDDIAQLYADLNNISLDEAKEKLKSILGDPQRR